MAEYLDLAKSTVASGEMTLPGSKSISNRVLLLAALSQGDTVVRGLLDSDDTRVMLAALHALGVALDVSPDKTTAKLCGVKRFPSVTADIFLGNAGTAFRPLTAALALMGGDHYHLHGVPRMHERPIRDLVTALKQMGAEVHYVDNEGYPPLTIGKGNITLEMPVQVRGDVSSQFLTALLMAAPLACQQTGRAMHIQVEGELISKPYINITLNLMEKFGVQVENHEWQRFVVPADACYQSPSEIYVEGDASSASYFMALGAIAEGPVTIHGVGQHSIQGDIRFADTLRLMGAQIELLDNAVVARGINVARGDRLKAFDLDFNLIPDAAMTAAVLALYADGPCYLRNIASWRVKETDRIHAMHTELTKLGAMVTSTHDSLCVHPLAVGSWKDAVINTYDDHRMAMCFSLAAFGGAQLRILDPACVSKTFPEYFSVYTSLLNGV